MEMTSSGSRKPAPAPGLLYRDVVALTDQATFLSSKINFLLDATLGFINLQQNQIIKIFSVAAVIPAIRPRLSAPTRHRC